MTKHKDLYNLILQPVISEKANLLNSANKYIFFVNKKTNKQLIKQSVEFIFNVKVDDVNTLNIIAKKIKFKGVRGTQNSKKKAIVTLADGYTIDLVKGI